METAETMCSNGTHDYKGDNFMKTVSIINLKGGVAKTLTTVSMAYALSQQYNARVLVVDNDKQGNCSKTFGVHSYDRQSIADLMLDRDADLAEVIQHTKYDRIDVYSGEYDIAHRKYAGDDGQLSSAADTPAHCTPQGCRPVRLLSNRQRAGHQHFDGKCSCCI